MNRNELGARLCNWHRSMNDPIYMVGSFYLSDKVYPDGDIVSDAMNNLSIDLSEREKMLRGEKVSVPGKTDDLRSFAGYTDKQLKEDISDLKEIIFFLKMRLQEDHNITQENI